MNPPEEIRVASILRIDRGWLLPWALLIGWLLLIASGIVALAAGTTQPREDAPLKVEESASLSVPT